MTQTELNTETPTTAVAKVDLTQYPARVIENVRAVAEVLRAEAQTASGVSPFDLQRIKMPTGGMQMWMVPTASGEEAVKAFEGIILDWRETRVFWEGTIEKTGGGQPPDCSAEDGIHGNGRYGVGSIENRSGLCQTCPMAQWGSKDGGKGQACRSVRQVAILRPGELLPTLLFLSPASLKPFKRYLFSLASRGVVPSGAITSFGLTPAKSGGGIAYSQVAPTLSAVIPPDERAWVQNYRDELLPAFKKVAAAEFGIVDPDDDDDPGRPW